MDRRGFLRILGVGAAGAIVAPAAPFNRVWSFPKNIVVPQLIGSTFNIRIPMRFMIGDIITVNSFGPFIVTKIAESGARIDIYNPRDGHGVLHTQPSMRSRGIRTLAHKFWDQERIDEIARFEKATGIAPRFVAQIES